jgi:hypothetical protein
LGPRASQPRATSAGSADVLGARLNQIRHADQTLEPGPESCNVAENARTDIGIEGDEPPPLLALEKCFDRAPDGLDSERIGARRDRGHIAGEVGEIGGYERAVGTSLMKGVMRLPVSGGRDNAERRRLRDAVHEPGVDLGLLQFEMQEIAESVLG